ncbi:indigoidine synthase A-like protein [Coniophora puteana RWD-64-598 SS2]|uniref:Indigoidine synthase A-like protein n=1 Tax=Coniophora puteana (strain RWD-64-598) TaxID=741705 RepID=A0A5M3N6D3_CONPW|nr:indigoidine synthase A-like protein [Coniophora puteana RWD-64-598 SS2]EIW86777.1 indigoidine synthase A-like protein [Coniophora puteana RWD-64-598 SS2]
MSRLSVRRLSSQVRRPDLATALRRNAPVDVHPEVEDALATHKPVVALESTIITHGMPYPTSLKMARSVENIVRSTGSVPATIAIIQGRVKIGLHTHELERLADQSSASTAAVKVSRRDVAPVLAMKKDGGTTCSSTLIFAALAGIKVFATGGLGGVHRRGESTMDVSADLHELTRCPVGLVSAGVKSILDIGRTLEYLETLGVPVLTYGPTKDFPAFYTRTSGFQSPWNVEDPQTAAQILHNHWQLGMSNGALFAAPIPEKYEAAGLEVQKAVEIAVRECEELGMHTRGKEVTPWLLKRVGELTGTQSLTNNVALVKNTALIGGRIASEYAKLSQDLGDLQPVYHHTVQSPASAQASQFLSSPTDAVLNEAKSDNVNVLVFGSSAVDITSRPAPGSDAEISAKSTCPGLVSTSLGGVGRNIAEAAHRVSNALAPSKPSPILLVSPVGDDAFGRQIINDTGASGLYTNGLFVEPDKRSAVCNMILDTTGNLVTGIADMDIVQNQNSDKLLSYLGEQKPWLVALDANMSPTILTALVEYSVQQNINIFFEPTSLAKSTAILPAIAKTLGKHDRAPVTFASPNLLELGHMYREVRSSPLELMSHDVWWKTIDRLGLGHQFRAELEHLSRLNASEDNPDLGSLSFLIKDGVAQMAINMLPFFQNLVIKCGERGVIIAMHLDGHSAQSSQWANEPSNVRQRLVVARASSGDVVVFQHFPALSVPQDSIVNVTGAGDSLVGSLVASLAYDRTTFLGPGTLANTISLAQHSARLSLQSPWAVSPLLSSGSTAKPDRNVIDK